MNVLFLTHRLPYAPNRGDRIRAYYLLKEISQYATVSLFSLVHDADEELKSAHVPFAHAVATSRVPRYTNFVRGALRLWSSQPLTHALLSAPGVREKLTTLIASARPDVVLAYCSGMARFAMEPPLDRIPFVLDLVDVDSQKWLELSQRTSAPLKGIYQREARTLSCFEHAAAARARAVLVVNARERDLLANVASAASLHVVGNGVDVPSFAPPGPPEHSRTVIFSGVMNYAPNVEAVVWFATKVWPRVLVDRPDARFVVVGTSPPSLVRELANRDPSIQVTGRVDAVQPHLWRAAISVAPLRLARGVQNKVLEALAAGLPAVVTSAVGAGLPAGTERGCLIADTPEDFSRAVMQLLDLSPESRRQMAAASGIDTLTWSALLAPIRHILEESISCAPAS